MGKLNLRHIVEAAVWLGLVALLYFRSFKFEREIEIYKFGASTWPRAILLLIAVAAIGQLVSHYRTATRRAAPTPDQPEDGDAEDAPSAHTSLRWYGWTFLLLAIPFVYLLLPKYIAAVLALDKAGLELLKLASAALLVAVYLAAIRGNPVGGILALPILFAALLQDFGFYALAPLFILGVMYLFGERRGARMGLVTAGLVTLLLVLFVSLLYVGLPVGNLSPFYEIGTTVVNILQ